MWAVHYEKRHSLAINVLIDTGVFNQNCCSQGSKIIGFHRFMCRQLRPQRGSLKEHKSVLVGNLNAQEQQTQAILCEWSAHNSCSKTLICEKQQGCTLSSTLHHKSLGTHVVTDTCQKQLLSVSFCWQMDVACTLTWWHLRKAQNSKFAWLASSTRYTP